MLRAVESTVALPTALRRAGLYGLDHDLAQYVQRLLLVRWPGLVVTVARAPEDLLRLRLQLWICGRVPPDGTRSPVLWLDGLGQEDEAPLRLAPQLWRLTTPLTGARLMHGVERVLAA